MRPWVFTGLLVPLVPASVGLAAAVAPLNPLAFGSLGTVTADVFSSYTFNTGNGTTVPTLTRQNTFFPSDKTVYTGVVYNGVAVFDFDALTLPGGTVTGTLPIALLSRGSVTFNQKLMANATGAAAGPGGGAAGQNPILTPATPGGGPGGGSSSQGGAYGNFGGTGQSFTNPNNKTYGNYDDAFHAGSGGGASSVSLPAIAAVSGGAGGGAVQISALGDIQFLPGPTSDGFGGVLVNGGAGAAYAGANGGGGSGGGIFLATPGRVINDGILSAAGGDSGASSNFGGETPDDIAGGGSGGRILVEAGNGYLTAGTFNGNDTVLGGQGYEGSAYSTGNNGTFFVTGYVSPVPEPATLAFLGVAGVMAAQRRR